MHDIARLIATLIWIEVILIIVRVLLSWFPGIDPWNPMVRVLRAVVDPVLLPFRRILPTFSGIDLSPILAIVVLDQARNVLDDYASGLSLTIGYVIATIIGQLIYDILLVFVIIIALRLLMSLLRADPFHPLVRLVREVSAPVVQPFRGIAPRTRSVDVAAIVALAVLIICLIVENEGFKRLREHLL